MTQAYQRVLVDLPQLTAEERKAVRSRLSAMTDFVGDNDSTNTSGFGDEIIVLEAIIDVTSRLAGEPNSIPTLRRADGYASFKRKAIALVYSMNYQSLSRVRQGAIITLGFELLYRNLRDQSMPATARTLMRHTHRIHGVLDSNFPGYSEAGLLGWIVRDG